MRITCMKYFERRLAEIEANPPKAPAVTFDELIVPPDEEDADPLLPNRLIRLRHAR